MSTLADRQLAIQQAKKSIERMQAFKPESMVRREELGAAMSFEPAVVHAQRLVDLYSMIPIDALDALNLASAQRLRESADADYKLFSDMMQFSTEMSSPAQVRSQLIGKVEQAYEAAFERVYPVIAFAANRLTDFAAVGREARATIQQIEDQSKRLADDLKSYESEAKKILEDVRKTAAEQGVSQQAVHFKDEADAHSKSADAWLKHTARLTVLVVAYAISTLFIHRIPFLAPTSSFETVQLAVSKVLVFTALAYFLLLAARNFVAHRHNAIVNKHRQNALVTYTALVDAAGETVNRDIVLSKVAECIFSPQPTGFGKADSGADSGPVSMVSLSSSALRPSTTAA
ncbi:MAG: hypothetical protein KF768_06495 [Phycisphaeraceae bacterium]|nr:hypothetical protein [Phycisphaeraceae bacterium]